MGFTLRKSTLDIVLTVGPANVYFGRKRPKNMKEDLTPRQETTSPAIAGAKKFLFNSSDPNLDQGQ